MNVHTKPTLIGDPVVDEARRRFDRASEWESVFRQRFLNDIKFENGDSDNGFQWPNEIRNARDTTARPCLTMNLIQRHNKMISNDLRKNKSSVKFIGMGNGATQESANVVQDLFRHMEYISQAQNAYTLARSFQIGGGRGWWRLVTDWANDDTVDEQEIKVLPVLDPLSIYMDPDIQQKSGLDAKWAFVFDDMPEEEFEEAYPDLMDLVGNQPLGMGTVSGDWLMKGRIRVCEYFRKVPKKGQNISFLHDDRTRITVPEYNLSKIIKDKDQRAEILDHPSTRIRNVIRWEVEWKLIAGEHIIDETTWRGKYIPLIRCIGEENVIEGVYDCKGHTRWSKDAQRMYNYNASGQVEFVGGQTKTPWLAAAKAIEEHEAQWNSSNVQTASVLIWNHVDPGNPDQPVPPPIKIDPPQASPGYEAGMSTANNQIMMTSGQFQNELGMMGNERTGAAIEGRKQQSDTANFHFQDNYEDALRTTGIMFIDLFPKIFDTQRVERIQAEDGTDYDLEIDPGARQGYLEQVRHNKEVIRRIFNPQLGRYGIAASVGPSFESKMGETADALTNIVAQAPALIPIIGDLLVASLPFDKAQEAAIRLKRMIPPIALGEGPSQGEQQLQAQLQSLQAAFQKLLDEKAKDQLKLVGKEQLREIESYDAETKRISAMAKLLPEDMDGLKRLISQLVEDSLSTSITNVLSQHAPKVDTNGTEVEPAPIAGAQKAPDGEWYLTDPTRKGKYLHVAPLAQLHKRPGVIENA